MPQQHQMKTGNTKHNSSKPKTDKRATFTVTAPDGPRPNSGNGSDSSDSNKPSSGDDSKNGKTTASTTTGTGGTSDTMTSQVKGKFLPSSYKIKWCRTQLETGYCPYEVKCMFAHSEAELRTRFQNVEDGITTEDAVRRILRERVRQHRRALKRAAAERDAEDGTLPKKSVSSSDSSKHPDLGNKNCSDDSSSIGSLDFEQLANDCCDDDDDGDSDILAMVEQRRRQEANLQAKKPTSSSKGVGFDKHSPKYYVNPDLPLLPKGKGTHKCTSSAIPNGNDGKPDTKPVSIRVGMGSGIPPPKGKKTSPSTNDSTSSPGAEGNGSGNGVSGNGNSGNDNSGTSNSSSGKQVTKPVKPNEPPARPAPTPASSQSGSGLMPVPSAVPGTGQAGSNSGGLMPMPMMYAPHQQQQYMPVMMVPTPMMPAYAPHQQAMMAPTAAAGQAATPHGFVPIGVPQPYFFAGGAPPQPTGAGMHPRATVYGTAAGAAASQPMYIQPMPPGQPMPGMYSFAPVPPAQPQQPKNGS